MGDFKVFTSPHDYYDKVLSKIAEFNSNLGEDVSFSEVQIKRLKEATICLCKGSPVEPASMDLVAMMLRWPPQFIFPGLDLVRLALTTSLGCAHFIVDAQKGFSFLQTLMDYACDGSHVKNRVPALRAIANFFAHDVGAQVMHSCREQVLKGLEELFESTNRTHQISVSTILLNYCHYYGKSTSDVAGMNECVLFLSKILSSAYDLEAKFRAVIGIGTLVLADKHAVESSLALVDLSDLIQPLVTITDPAKVGQCSQCLLQILNS